MEDFTLVPVPPEWWRKIADFDLENFGIDAWSTRMWELELRGQGRTYLALVTQPGPIRTEGALVGVGGISHGPEAELLTIAVSEHLRGRGLGRELLRALLATARSHSAEAVFLEVRASDAGAQRFYQREGFEPVGLRKKYYRNDDAVVMKLELAGRRREKTE